MTQDALREAGIGRYGTLPTEKIVFSEEIRRICETNTCRLYGSSWACPPAVGSVAQCRERCLQYRKAMVFSAAYPLADSFDYEGMKAGHAAFKTVCDRLCALAKDAYPQFLLLGNEGCSRCRTCTYPAAPCRMPEMLFPSLEGYGIQVNELAGAAGIPYCSGPDTVTYFGMLLFDRR